MIEFKVASVERKASVLDPFIQYNEETIYVTDTDSVMEIDSRWKDEMGSCLFSLFSKLSNK